MKKVATLLFGFFVHLGGFGLLILGILDSSFLFMPLGNDLLMIAMTARKQSLVMLYYAAMASLGSVAGCFLVDLVARKGGEEGLEKYVPRKRLEYVKNKVKKSAGWALAVASLAPPPFPFTPFVAGAAALQYPRKRLLTIIAVTRMIRFSGEGVLALYFGERILRWAENPFVTYGVVALIVISFGGSALSIYRWIRKSRKAEQPQPAES